MQTVENNAKQAFMLYKTRRSGDFTARTQALNDLQDALGMDEAPLRMECFDVSHLGGTNIVASMVVFEDGLPRKDQYRKFSVPEYAGRYRGDLPGAEPAARIPAGTRRRRRAGHEAEQAEVLVSAAAAHRGRRSALQVQAAARALADAGVQGIQLAGIAKRLEEIWLPGLGLPGDPAAQRARRCS